MKKGIFKSALMVTAAIVAVILLIGIHDEISGRFFDDRAKSRQALKAKEVKKRPPLVGKALADSCHKVLMDDWTSFFYTQKFERENYLYNQILHQYLNSGINTTAAIRIARTRAELEVAGDSLFKPRMFEQWEKLRMGLALELDQLILERGQ